MRLPFSSGFWRPWGRPPVRETPSVAIVTCIKNEGEDLVEWLCFHRHIGVSRFIIYDNLSTDATLRILEKMPFADEITVHSVPDGFPQRTAFNDAVRRYRGKLDWVAFIDGDEFIVPLGEVTLLERLAELQARGIDGLGLHWRIFGSAGHKVRPTGLVTESFIRRAKDDFRTNRHVKSIVRIGKVQSIVTQHYFRVSGRYLLDDGSEPPADFQGIAERPTFKQGFAINHYITKSYAQCMQKIARGRPRPDGSRGKYRTSSYWTSFNRNQWPDDRAAEVIAPIRDDVLRLRDEIHSGLGSDSRVPEKVAPPR